VSASSTKKTGTTKYTFEELYLLWIAELEPLHCSASTINTTVGTVVANIKSVNNLFNPDNTE
jgi:hypothetical protein